MQSIMTSDKSLSSRKCQSPVISGQLAGQKYITDNYIIFKKPLITNKNFHSDVNSGLVVISMGEAIQTEHTAQIDLYTGLNTHLLESLSLRQSPPWRN